MGLDLLPHNEKTGKLVNKRLEKENIASLVHATGSGKSYIAINFILENFNKKGLFVVPYNSIKEHIISILKENNLMYLLDNLEIITYQSLVDLSLEDLKKLKYDYIILDEFHHIGAPVWGKRIDTLIKNNKDAKVLGMTAYTIRDRNTIYERDMAQDGGVELFSDTVVSRYDLSDAILDGILKQPIYKSGYIHLLEFANSLEVQLSKSKLPASYKKELTRQLSSIKTLIKKESDIGTILKSNLKRDGRYIYFCPGITSRNDKSIDDIMESIRQELLQFLDEDDFVLYKTTSDNPKEGYENRKAFSLKKDLDGNLVSDKLQIMFAINQYNEGSHVKDLDGVILGRTTNSDIVYYEQIGRALSVFSENPLIIDLTNNLTFIKELEDNIKHRFKEAKKSNAFRPLMFKSEEEIDFKIEMENVELFNILTAIKSNIKRLNFDDYFLLLTNFKNHYGHCNVYKSFKTFDGINYDENGYTLGVFVQTYKDPRLNISEDKRRKLDSIGFCYDFYKDQWEFYFGLFMIYKEKFNSAVVHSDYITEEGYRLGNWVSRQRSNKKLSLERRTKLKDSGFVFDVFEERFDVYFNLLLQFKEKYGHLKVVENYVIDDYELGIWVRTQRGNKRMNLERKKRLEDIGFIFDVFDDVWNTNYNVLKQVYDELGHIDIKQDYECNGCKIGFWLSRQRNNKDLSLDKKKLLDDLGIIWDLSDRDFLENYKLLVLFKMEFGHVSVPFKYVTKDGFKLGNWVSGRRLNKEALSLDNIELLNELDFVWFPRENKRKIKEICFMYNIDYSMHKSELEKLNAEYVLMKLKYLEENNFEFVINNTLHPIFFMTPFMIQEQFNVNDFYTDKKYVLKK
ncbi:MAG: Helicase associated domain protein [Mycoplasmatota bacterium]